ncbi:GNAT family N-acetyltransferase [Streptomyces sp. JJ38]|uniref:GNAT family N-acetyltransferase n=1 Tax=Streptomyces sp. JJ38 TaxID=2738128 RepID=UPI001C56B941|nr:GNAT family N-acetyltransferase [Streptomyces sp. JJ38]MBW1597038.1 GNAT family N-acetyltransferase [Streptomyces sp. JJ38]
MEQNEPILRPITGREELDVFNRLPYALNGELADDLTQGRRRPEWMWVAQRGGRLLARLAWWSRPGDAKPFLMDVLDVDDTLPGPERVALATRLLRTAMAATLPEGATPPPYTRFVPPGWQDEADTRQTVRDRMAAVEETGARLFVERIRLEWRPGTPLGEPRGRLTFRPPQDTEELLTLMTSALEGTLDAHSLDDLSRMSLREAAVSHYEDELARYKSPRDWWRVATLPDGTPVGFVLPAHNGYNPIIAYLAVLPEHRGNGYIDDVLAEGTRVLAGQDVPRVRASTDLGNVPMARAFQRAGYVSFEHEINMTWR